MADEVILVKFYRFIFDTHSKIPFLLKKNVNAIKRATRIKESSIIFDIHLMEPSSVDR